MKTVVYLALSVWAIVEICTACSTKTNYPIPSQYHLTADDASDAIASALSSNANGIAAELSAINTFNTSKDLYTTAPALQCGNDFDTAFNRTSNGGNNYNYNESWDYRLYCSGGKTDSIIIFQQMHGSYSVASISGIDTSYATLTVLAPQTSSSDIMVSGTYMRNGKESSKVRSLLNYHTVMNFILRDVTINKSTQQITGGAATVSFTGTGLDSNGRYYGAYYMGTISFNENNNATLVINGNAYNIAL
jgi:hypothetical protein